MDHDPTTVAEPDQAGESPPAPTRPSARERVARLRTRAQHTRRAVVDQAGALRERSPAARLAYEAYDNDRRHAGALLAGGLAYRLFLWLLPAALVIASALGVVADLTSSDPSELASDAGLGAALTATVAQAAEDSGRGAIVLLLTGIVLMLWAGRSVVKALRLISCVAWQLRPTPLRKGVRAAALFAGVAFGFLLVPVILERLYGGPFAADVLVWGVTTAALVLPIAWILSVLPHPEGLPFLAFVPGAVLIAVALQVTRLVTNLYLAGRLDNADDLYGALGIATVFMAWLFIIGRLVVAGMALNAIRAVERLRRDAVEPTSTGKLEGG